MISSSKSEKVSDQKDIKSKAVNLLPTELKISLYDEKGYVELIDMMPRLVPLDRTADVAVSNAARVSTQQGNKTKKDDDRLVKRLMIDRHTSPFEMVKFKFHIRCPIFVQRQLIRHRMANVNEASYRYSVAPDLHYFPKLRMQSKSNKQGSSDADVPVEAEKVWEKMQDMAKQQQVLYDQLIEMGVSREVARVGLPVSLMTTLTWCVDLHNLTNFLRLRCAKDAQLEIRVLADAIMQLVEPLAPVSIQTFRDMSFGSITFSSTELQQLAGDLPVTKAEEQALALKVSLLSKKKKKPEAAYSASK